MRNQISNPSSPFEDLLSSGEADFLASIETGDTDETSDAAASADGAADSRAGGGLAEEEQNSDGEGSDPSFARFASVATDNYYVGASPDNAGFLREDRVVPSTIAAAPLAEPLQSINWGYTAPSIINVFFAPSGVSVDDGLSDFFPFTTSGWSAAELAAANAAFQNFENVCNVTFNVVNNVAAADFVMLESSNATTSLGYWAVGGGTLSDYGGSSLNLDGWGVFNSGDASWTPAGLAVGGYGYITLIHEIGHGMGLAHPHDPGGTSTIMDGVTGPFGSYGTTGLNQGIWTTMTYNDGWHAVNGNMPVTQGYGWQGTLMTLDIAVLQATYGAVAHNTGANTYTLPSLNAAGTYYQAIWDTGGTDTIVNPGAGASTINLNAASLANNSTGGGFLSFVAGILGGFTIANGVVIENATGGTGNDTITGNSAANLLNGGGGVGMDTINGGGGGDTLLGQGGNDTLNGDAGNDTVSGGDGNDTASGGLNDDQVLGGNGNDNLNGNDGNDTVSGGANDDSCQGGNGNDTVYGGAGIDSVFGQAGLDIMTGGDGVDNMSGGSEADEVYGQAGVDTLNGDSGNDTVSGGDDGDFLYGGANNDAVIGGNGNDFLDGGTGNDALTGGANSDIFYFSNGYQADAAQGFTNDVDTLQLDNTLWVGVLTVAQVIASFATQTSPGIVTFDFGGGDILTVINGAGITTAQLQNDITIV